MKAKLTESQANTLFIVQTINEVVKSNTLYGEKLETNYNSSSEVYSQLFENDSEDTLDLMSEIVELSKLGYVSTNIKESDLNEDSLRELLIEGNLEVTETGLHELNNWLKIKGIVKDVLTDEELLKTLAEIILGTASIIINDSNITNLINSIARHLLK